MNIFIMTDMEGCACIPNVDDWVVPSGRYYEQGKRILTDETNAVIAGLAEGGATEFLVCDGHGAGGIDLLALDPRALYQRGWPTEGAYPFGLNASFDAVVCVGQHARAGTDFSHITHTQSFEYVRQTLNGIEIGEYGELALCAAELGVPCIFAGGEEALRHEVEELTPDAVTVGVKRGVQRDGLDHLSRDAYAKAKLGAVHRSHAEACRLLHEGAREAATRFAANPKSFALPRVTGRYTLSIELRATPEHRPRTMVASHSGSIIALLNQFWQIAREA